MGFWNGSGKEALEKMVRDAEEEQSDAYYEELRRQDEEAERREAERIRSQQEAQVSLNKVLIDEAISSVRTIDTNRAGLRADEISPSFQEGDFCALLSPLMLAQVSSNTDNMYINFVAWTNQIVALDERGLYVVHYVAPAPARRLWYRAKHVLSDAQLKMCGPGAVLIDRTTNRLMFVGPDEPQGTSVEIFADWDVKAALGTHLLSSITLFQAGASQGWKPAPSDRFGMIG